MARLVLQGEKLNLSLANEIAEQVSGQLTSPDGQAMMITTQQTLDSSALNKLRADHAFDINVLPEQFDPRKLIISQNLKI